MAEKAETTAVIDIGSAYIKCGLQGDDSPREIIPTVVGTPASLTVRWVFFSSYFLRSVHMFSTLRLISPDKTIH